MISAYVGKRLFKVYVDHPCIDRVAKLWKFVDRIEELYCWYGNLTILSFLASLGSASNLKVFRLRDGLQGLTGWQPRNLPNLFQGCLPSLRELSLATPTTWQIGLFKNLRSFELGVNPDRPISPTHVLDALRESPSLESFRLAGRCELPDEEPPAIALPSLRDCTLIGNGAISLIWYMDIPASTNVSLSTPPPTRDATEVYPFRDLCLAPCLHVLDDVSTVSFFIGFDAIKFRTQNKFGGVLNIQVYYHENVLAGLMAFTILLNNPFYESPCRIQTTREFALHIERGVSRDDAEALFYVVMISKFISGIPSLEQVELRGVPAKALSCFLRLFHKNPQVTIPFPNLQRLCLESTPLHSPKSLIADLDDLLKGREGFGLPLQFVDATINCEALIPMAEHSTFLTAWERLVGEDVRITYSRDRVEKLPRRGLRMVFFEGEGEDDEDGEDVGAVESTSGSDLDWESWTSGKWPKAASEMKGLTGR